MSIQTEISVGDFPTKTRIKKIEIFNGSFYPDGSIRKSPYVRLQVVRCWQSLDENGDPVLNAFGQPVYEDTVLEAEYEVTDMAELMAHLVEHWEPLMQSAEATIEDAVADGKFELPMPQLGI